MDTYLYWASVHRFQQAHWEKALRLEQWHETGTKLEKFKAGEVLILQGPECCAQEFGLHSVNSGRPAKAPKLRNDMIRSDNSFRS